MRRLHLFGWLAVAALGVGACGSARLASDAPAHSQSPYRMQVAQSARKLALTTSSFQAAMLRDGDVTVHEYAESTDAMIRCLRRSTVPLLVGSARPAPGGELEFEWSLDTPDASTVGRLQKSAWRTFDRCHRAYEDDVKLIYSNQRVIPEPERPAVLRKLVACMRHVGLTEVPDQPSMRQLATILKSERGKVGVGCADRYADLFRFLAPVPASGA
jgi:hypothetical protein